MTGKKASSSRLFLGFRKGMGCGKPHCRRLSNAIDGGKIELSEEEMLSTRLRLRLWLRRGRQGDGYRDDSGVSAGPARTFPLGPKREPWQGQSQVDSAWFQRTRQPMWVQTGDIFFTVPRSSR